MARKGTCYYKVILNCEPCGRFVIIDRRPFKDGRTYTVGCEECRKSATLMSGLCGIDVREINQVGGTRISFVRKG